MDWTPKQIQGLREHLGWTQTEMGRYLGYAESGAQVRISELERGVRRVSGAVERLLALLADEHHFRDEQANAEAQPPG